MEESMERLTQMMQGNLEAMTKKFDEIQEALQLQNERIASIERIRRDNASGSQQGSPSRDDERASTISEAQSKRGTASEKTFLATEHALRYCWGTRRETSGTKEDKKRQQKTRQEKKRQDKTRQDKKRQDNDDDDENNDMKERCCTQWTNSVARSERTVLHTMKERCCTQWKHSVAHNEQTVFHTTNERVNGSTDQQMNEWTDQRINGSTNQRMNEAS